MEGAGEDWSSPFTGESQGMVAALRAGEGVEGAAEDWSSPSAGGNQGMVAALRAGEGVEGATEDWSSPFAGGSQSVERQTSQGQEGWRAWNGEQTESRRAVTVVEKHLGQLGAALSSYHSRLLTLSLKLSL